MDIWLNVKTEYSEYMLFSENYNSTWIFLWFNEKIPDILRKFDKDVEIKVEYSIINEFFHDCLELVLDPYNYISSHDFICPVEVIVSDKFIMDIQFVCAKILKKCYESRIDLLGTTEYFLGSDVAFSD